MTTPKKPEHNNHVQGVDLGMWKDPAWVRLAEARQRQQEQLPEFTPAFDEDGSLMPEEKVSLAVLLLFPVFWWRNVVDLHGGGGPLPFWKWAVVLVVTPVAYVPTLLFGIVAAIRINLRRRAREPRR